MSWYRGIYIKGLHFKECLGKWHWITSWNVDFVIMSTLFCFGFQGGWEQEGNVWQYFQRKILNKKVWVDFLQIMHFFISDRKTSSKSWTKQRTYYTTKTLTFFLIGIHSMQGWTATTRRGVTRKRSTSEIKAYRKSV